MSMSRRIELENAARQHIIRKTNENHETPVRQNALAAYLSSALCQYPFISIEQAITICVENDTDDEGNAAAYNAVANGIKEATYISNNHMLKLLQMSTNENKSNVAKYIGISALEALAEKTVYASLNVLEKFVAIALQQIDECGTVKALYRSLVKILYRSLVQSPHEVEQLKLSIEKCLRETERNTNPGNPFDIRQYVELNDVVFTPSEFKELRELKKVTQKQLAVFAQCNERSIYRYETESIAPNRIIQALLQI